MYKLLRNHVDKGASIMTHNIRTMATNNIEVPKFEEQIKPWHEIPGPLSLPLIGQLFHFLPGGWLYKRKMDLQELLYKNYGPIVRLDGNLGFVPITYLFDPEAAINLFRKEEPLPHRPGFESMLYQRQNYYKDSKDSFAGLTVDNGEKWKKLRLSVNSLMLKPKSIRQYTDIMTEVAEDMIIRMKQLRNKENMLDCNLYTELNMWALESIGVVALGCRLNCLDPTLPEDSPTKKLINIIHEIMDSAEKLDFQPSLWKYISTPTFKKGMKAYESHLKLNEFFIDQAREQFSLLGASEGRDKSILERLLDIDRNVAVAMANDMLFAGVDTAACTVLGLLYLLAVNKEKQEELREQIFTNKEDRSYLRACIKESLRIYPILAGNFRRTTKEHDVLGYRIPKNINVIVGNQILCLMEDQFPRPTEFLPERWLVDRSDPLYYGNAHPFTYTPFGYGVRGCIGRRIAEVELEIFITKIVENFKVEWLGPPPERSRTSTLNFFLGPYNFIFKDLVEMKK